MMSSHRRSDPDERQDWTDNVLVGVNGAGGWRQPEITVVLWSRTHHLSSDQLGSQDFSMLVVGPGYLEHYTAASSIIT